LAVVVLRLGHRPMRDKRLTTHVALAARALGAKGIVLTEEDKNIAESVADVVARWGGDFFLEVREDWKGYIKDWKGKVVHLTMYGLPFQEVLEELGEEDILLVVGSEKVPGKLFELADYNVAVTGQPHSEVSALSLFLDRYFGGEELDLDFKGGIEVIPSARSKKVLER